MLREALGQGDEGIYQGQMRYANNQATVADCADSLQFMINKLQEMAEVYGLKIGVQRRLRL
mgnify:CR=1 FL=1